MRFGGNDDGLRLGVVMIGAAGEIVDTVRYGITARATGDGDQNPIGLTEAYLEWRPYPSIVASAYGWNDPAGILLFQRGWGIHDRQTELFGELPRPLIRDPSILLAARYSF